MWARPSRSCALIYCKYQGPTILFLTNNSTTEWAWLRDGEVHYGSRRSPHSQSLLRLALSRISTLALPSPYPPIIRLRKCSRPPIGPRQFSWKLMYTTICAFLALSKSNVYNLRLKNNSIYDLDILITLSLPSDPTKRHLENEVLSVTPEL